MRKLAIILTIISLSFTASSQTLNPFPTTDSLRKWVNKWIRNSAVDAFTNLRLNSGLIGMTRLIDSAYGGQVTGLEYSDDTLRLSLLNGQVLKIEIVAASSTPTLQEVTNAGNTTTDTIYAPKFEATDVTDGGAPAAAFRVNRTLRLPINASGHGFRDQTAFRRPGYAYNSFDAAPAIDSAGTHDHLIGFQGRPTINHASAVVKYLYGGAASLPNILSGLADTLVGFDVSDYIGSGSATYNIAFRARPITKGAFDFAYYSDGTNTPSAFRGSLGLGLGDFVQPTERLDISGNLKVTGNILFNNAGASHDIKPATAVTALPFATQIFGNINAVNETNGGGLIEVHADDGSAQGGRVNIIPYGRNASPGAGAFVVSTRSGPGTIANRFTVEQYGAIRIGYISNSPHGFSVNRSVSFEKDSLLRRAVAGAWKVVIQDTSSTVDSNALGIISLADLGTALGVGGGSPSLSQNTIGVGDGSNLLSGSSAYTYDGTTVKQENTGAVNALISTTTLGASSGGVSNIYAKALPTAATDRLGIINFGSAGGATNDYVGASISAFANGSWTGGSSHFSRLIFSTTNSGSATPSEVMRISNSRVSIGTGITGTAYLTLRAGTSGANGAPLKFTSGTNQVTPEAGAVEYDGQSLFFTPSTTRLRAVLSNNVIPGNGQVPVGNGNDYTVSDVFTITTVSATGTTTLSGTIKMHTIKIDATSGNVTVTIAANHPGQVVNVKRMDNSGNTITVQGSVGNIDGGASITLTAQYETMQLQWDGSNWIEL